MKVIFLLFIICISLIITRDPPVITLYEESLCPDCLNFENTQISRLLKHPNKNLLFKSINTIWFGNAKELEDSAPFARKFICQHGSNECYGNYVFNCAQKNFISFDDLNNFYACVANFALDHYDNMDFDDAVYECTFGTFAKLILTCAKSGLGAELHHSAGLLTGPHKYVPHIIVDEVHTDEMNDAITTDIIKFLCDYVELTGEVEGC